MLHPRHCWFDGRPALRSGLVAAPKLCGMYALPSAGLCLVRPAARETPWRCAARQGAALGAGWRPRRKHHSSASLPEITLEMKCWFSFCFNFLQMCSHTGILTVPRGAMCVKATRSSERLKECEKSV